MSLFLAFLFSLIAPGAGQAYNGEWKKGVRLAVSFVLLSGLFDSTQRELTHGTLFYKVTITTVFFLQVGIFIGGLVEALIRAARLRGTPLHKDWKKAIFFCVVVTLFRILFKLIGGQGA